MNATPMTAADADSLRNLFAEPWMTGWSAHMASKRLKIDRPTASRLLLRCRRRGWIEHFGAWSLTPAGKAAIWPTPTGRAEG